MDIEAAFSRLPETHAAALRLRGRGFDHDAIAKALALERVASLLRIAEAKLEALTAMNPDGSGLVQSRGSCTFPIAECSHLRREIGHLADVSVGVASVTSATEDEKRRSARGGTR